MKRKLFALALTATMVLGLAACGGGSSTAAPAAGGADSTAAGGAEMTSGHLSGHRAAQSLSLFLQAQAATQTLQPVHLHSMPRASQALTSSLSMPMAHPALSHPTRYFSPLTTV